MIKKILKSFLTIWLIWLWIINFSNATFSIGAIGAYSNSINNGSYELAVLKKWSVLTQYLWVTKDIFTPWSAIFFWTKDWLPYIWTNYVKNDWTYTEWYLKTYYTCPEIVNSFNSSLCTQVDFNPFDPSDWTKQIFSSFMSSVTLEDNYWYEQIYRSWHWDTLTLCFSSKSLSQSLCFSSWLTRNGSTFYNVFTWSLNLWRLTFANIPDSVIWQSPWLSSWWWDWDNWNQSSWIILWSNESAINYFEKTYWWNEKICYVWVDSVDYMYWTSWISFEEWSWLSIFDTFEDLYWNRDLDKVYVWLNVWLFNYENWVWTSWNPSWLARYNSWTNQINVYYDNLTTSPFINQPVALWFMTSNIEVSYNTPYNTMGADVVSYCNIKINWWTFDEIQGDAIKDAITWYTEQSNKNKWLNPDWSVNVIDYSWFWTYTGDAWLSSGVNIAFSWNTTIKNTIENFFTTFDDALSWLDVNTSYRTSYRILPTWLVYIFIFIVLFKFFRKK